MRGVTNALPAGGGLKVIASGQLSPSDNWIQIQLPAPAQLVIIYRNIGLGYSTAIPVIRNTTAAGVREQDIDARFWLLEDGITLKYFDKYVTGGGSIIRYTAFA